MINFENYNLGALEFEKQNYSLSIEYFTKSIDENHILGNSFSLGYFYRASSYYYLKEFEKAIKDYEEASLSMFDDYKLYLFKGLTYFNLKKYDEAILDLNKVIELNQDFEGAYIQLYEIYRIIESHKLANTIFLKIIEFNPNNIEIISELGSKYMKAKLYNLSTLIYQDIYKVFPENSKAKDEYLMSILLLNKSTEKNIDSDNLVVTIKQTKENSLKETSVNHMAKKKMNIKNRVEKAFTVFNTLGEEESLESIIKSILISVLIGLSICLLIGWITSNERVFHDRVEYSDVQIERIESYFNYQAGLIVGSITTLFIFIKRLIPNKK